MIVLKSLSRAWIKRLAFAPSGTAVAAAAGGCGLLLWSELLNGKRAEALKVSIGEVDGLAYTPDGECLFGVGSTLCAVRLATREVTQFPVRGPSVGFAPAPDSARVIVCKQQYKSAAINTRNTCWSIRKPDAPVWEVVDDFPFLFRPFFVNDDHYLIVGSHNEKGLCLRTRSAKTGALVSEVSGVAQFQALSTLSTLSPDATRIANVSKTFIHVLPVSGPFNEKPVARNDNKRYFVDLAYHPSGKYLAVASNDETVKFFDTTTWDLVRTFTWKTGKMRAVCFSPDGTLAAAGGEKGQVVVWDVDL
jgi:WD40 repeat protein